MLSHESSKSTTVDIHCCFPLILSAQKKNRLCTNHHQRQVDHIFTWNSKTLTMVIPKQCPRSGCRSSRVNKSKQTQTAHSIWDQSSYAMLLPFKLIFMTCIALRSAYGLCRLRVTSIFFRIQNYAYRDSKLRQTPELVYITMLVPILQQSTKVQ